MCAPQEEVQGCHDSLLIGGQLSHDHVHGFYVLLEVLREEQGPACSESSASAKMVSAVIQDTQGRLGTSCSEGSLYLRASDARGPSSVTSASSSSSPGASNLPALALNLRARSSFLVLSARHPAPAPAPAAAASAGTSWTAAFLCLGLAACGMHSILQNRQHAL